MLAALLVLPSLVAQADPSAGNTLQDFSKIFTGTVSHARAALKAGITGGGEEREIENVIKKVAPGTVTIEVHSILKFPMGKPSQADLLRLLMSGKPLPTPDKDGMVEQKSGDIGTGFIVGKDEQGRPLIVTNAHVVDTIGRNGKAITKDLTGKSVNAEVISATMTILTSNGTQYSASLLGYSHGNDLALVRTNSACATGCKVLKLGDKDKVAVGEFVVALGAPLGLDNTVTFGIVSNTRREVPGGMIGEYIQTDAAINPGNSGGPLVDMSGKVIGVNRMIVTPNGGSVGLGLAIPIQMVKDMLNRYKASGIVNSSMLGMTVELSDNGSLQIESLTNDAQSQGLKVGDIISSVDGKTFNDPLQLSRYLDNKLPGQKAVFSLSRNAQSIDVTVTLKEMD